MRYTFLFSICLLLLFASCKKDKFATTPSLKFKSVNTTELHRQELLKFTLSFTDAEGDLTDNVFVQKIVPGCVNSNFEQLYPLPPFPTTKDQKGDLIITFGYNVTGYTDVLAAQCLKNDTAVFRFVLRDKAQHASDTVSSPQVTFVY
ncbi:MAG: hypothetical protein ABI834_10125 [Ginsengibacter sp.]